MVQYVVVVENSGGGNDGESGDGWDYRDGDTVVVCLRVKWLYPKSGGGCGRKTFQTGYLLGTRTWSTVQLSVQFAMCSAQCAV